MYVCWYKLERKESYQSNEVCAVVFLGVWHTLGFPLKATTSSSPPTCNKLSGNFPTLEGYVVL